MTGLIDKIGRESDHSRGGRIFGFDVEPESVLCRGQIIREDMKKIVISIAMACLCAGSARASIVNVVPAGRAVWTSTSSDQTINVDYEVDHDLVSGLYYYQYQVGVPVVDPPDPIESLEIDAGANTLAVIATPLVGYILDPYDEIGSILSSSAGLLNVQWNLTPITENTVSVVLAFTSPYAPTWGNGSAMDDGQGPWSSQNPGSNLVPVPVPVPEPTTIIAGALLLLPFGASTLRILRKQNRRHNSQANPRFHILLNRQAGLARPA